MAERTVAAVDNPSTEAVASSALFLIFAAVIAIAVSLAGLSTGDAPLAGIAGAIAALSFAASIACFYAQADDQP